MKDDGSDDVVSERAVNQGRSNHGQQKLQACEKSEGRTRRQKAKTTGV